MRISLVRISLLWFFKTFQIYLANAIIIFFILLLRFQIYFANVIIFFYCDYLANAILCAIYFITAIFWPKNLPNAILFCYCDH